MVDKIVWPAVSPQSKWPTTKPNAVLAILSGLELTGISAADVFSFFYIQKLRFF